MERARRDLIGEALLTRGNKSETKVVRCLKGSNFKKDQTLAVQKRIKDGQSMEREPGSAKKAVGLTPEIEEAMCKEADGSVGLTYSYLARKYGFSDKFIEKNSGKARN